MTSVEERTDSQFVEELIQLVEGTHWTQGKLETFCWVQVPTGTKPPEGVEIRKWVDLKGEEISFRKDQWCLVGMILKVANLPLSVDYAADGNSVTAEDAIKSHDQATRIVTVVADNLPEPYHSRVKVSVADMLESWMFGNDHLDGRTYDGFLIRSKWGTIESWNDDEDRTQEQVLEVLRSTLNHTRIMEHGPDDYFDED